MSSSIDLTNESITLYLQYLNLFPKENMFNKLSKNLCNYLLQFISLNDLLTINFLNKKFRSFFDQNQIKIFKAYRNLLQDKNQDSSNLHKLLQVKLDKILATNFTEKEKFILIENYFAYKLVNKHEDYYRFSFNKLNVLKQHFVTHFLRFLTSSQCAIKVLNFSMNELLSPDIEIAMSIGLSSNTSVKVLDLSEIKFEYNNACESLAQALQSNKSIEKIYLTKSTYFNYGVTHLLNILTGLTLNRSIKEAYMCNVIGNPSIGKNIADCLKVNESLKILSICNINLKDEGLSQLCKGMYQNKTLEKLFICENNIRNEGIIDLMLLMKAKSENSITHLDISKNPIQSQYFKLIAEMIEFNSSLEVFNMKNCGVTNEAVKLIAGSLKNNKNLKVLNIYSNEKIDKTVEEFINQMKELIILKIAL